MTSGGRAVYTRGEAEGGNDGQDRGRITTSVDGYITGPDDGPGCGLGVGGERLRLFDGFTQSLDLEHLGVRPSRYAMFIDYRVKWPSVLTPTLAASLRMATASRASGPAAETGESPAAGDPATGPGPQSGQ